MFSSIGVLRYDITTNIFVSYFKTKQKAKKQSPKSLRIKYVVYEAFQKMQESTCINLNQADIFSTSNNLDYLDTITIISVESNRGRN